MSEGGLLDILNELTTSESKIRERAGESYGGPTECPVCMEQMVDPTIVTTCGHTFCRDCLKEICKKEGRTIRCPIDRRPCVLPTDGVDGLPVNFALRDVAEAGRHVTEDAASLHSLRECSECHSTATLDHCEHCGENLCKECIMMHMDETTARLRRLSRDLRGATGRWEKSLTQRRMLLEDQRKICNSVREKVSDFTNTILSKMKKILKNHKQHLLDKIGKHQVLFEGKVGKQIHELESDERYVNECKTKIDKILNDTGISVTESQIKALDKGTSMILQKRPLEVTTKPLEYHFLIPSKDQQEHVYQQVTRLIDVARLTSDVSIHKEGVKQPSACNSEPEPRPNVPGHTAVGCTSVGRAQWSVLGTGEGSSVGQFVLPQGVAVSPATRTICVVDGNNHRVQWFNYDASHIRTVGERGAAAGQFNYPQEVACTSDGHFVISDMYNHRVKVLDSSGAVVCVMKEGSTGAGGFRFPNGVAVDTITGHIYVCDSGNHRVQIVRANGEFMGNFGSKGTSDGQFDQPIGIAIAQGRVIVADFNNNRLQVFTTAGKHTRTITGDHVKEPWGVALNKAGNEVYVCCKTGIVVHRLSPGPTVELVKHIPSHVAGRRPGWIAFLSESDALVTLNDEHVVHRIRVN